jgi:hypothetical protein
MGYLLEFVSFEFFKHLYGGWKGQSGKQSRE